jgi:hypothetical protein
VEGIADVMRRAFPTKAEPTTIIEEPAPGGPFSLVAYDFSAEEVRALPGLHARYEALDGRVLEERVDRMARLQWEESNTPPLPFTVHWRGVVFLDRPALASLVAVSDDPIEVLLEGRVSFSSQNGAPATFPQELFAGWHPVEVNAVKQSPGGAVSLRWMDGQGHIVDPLASEDLFPLRSLQGWRHRRTLTSTAEPWDVPVSERFDFAPYQAPQFLVLLRTLLNEEAPLPSLANVSVLREEWSAVWRVSAERDYTLQGEIAGGALVVTLDGTPIIFIPDAGQGGVVSEQADLRVPAGEHRLELIQTPAGHWTGATLTITDPNDLGYQPDLSPY